MKKVLVTGAAGEIGSAVAQRLSGTHTVIGTYHEKRPFENDDIVWEQVDLFDSKRIQAVFTEHSPDVVIHCAAIAHENVRKTGRQEFRKLNAAAPEHIAATAAYANPAVLFVFLSSIVVYGEKKLKPPVKENSALVPSGDYAASKIDAEKRLIALFDQNVLNNLLILRLAPVYSRESSFNLDRRVLAPGGVYIRFGSGKQRMSALAKSNLADFITFALENASEFEIMNLCDEKACSFRTIIDIFKKSGFRPARPVIPVPLPLVWLTTRFLGLALPEKRKWLHACYDKLASDIVVDNKRMLKTGFKPRHTLENTFSPYSEDHYPFG